MHATDLWVTVVTMEDIVIVVVGHRYLRVAVIVRRCE
jgi:hypothetical protein